MVRHNDADYYARRERQERERAQVAPSPVVRDIHVTLARNYARRASQSVLTES